MGRASQLHGLLRANHAGNPYHDDDGKFAEGPGGHGKHHAKRARRRKRIAALRKKWHAEAADMKRQHKGYFKGSKGEHRREWNRLKREQSKEKATARNRFAKEHAKLQASHGKEYASQKAGAIESLKEDVAASGDKHAAREKGRQQVKANLAELKQEHSNAMAEQHEDHKKEWSDLKAGHAKDRQDFKAEAKDTVVGLKEDVAREKTAFWAEFHADVKANGLKLKRSVEGGDRGQRSSISDHDSGHCSGDGQHESSSSLYVVPGLDVVRRVASGAPGRFPRSKTSKAGSAESILKHLLQRRGWTKRFREGKLTERQCVRLLEDVRLYGRAWLRHEAEGVFGASLSGHLGRSGISLDGDNILPLCQHDRLSAASREGMLPTEAGRGESRAIGDPGPIRRFFARAKQFVRELIFAGVMAIRGARELDASETEQADRAADAQERFFDGFQRDISGPNPPSPRQSVARAESYANSAWQSAQRASHSGVTGNAGQPPRKLRSGNPARWERRVLGHPKTEHCHDCPPFAALGWQPIGTLPAIGESECGHLCLCHFEYSESLEKPEMKKPRKPKPKRPLQPGIEINITKPAPASGQPAAPPTDAEIKQEMQKFIEGKPSRITVHNVKPRAPEPEFVMPEGYEWSD